MTAAERLDDAEFLWAHGRREGAMLSVLVAAAAVARRHHPKASDREAFEGFLQAQHDWTISVEFRGQQCDVDHLLYKWMRCELAHTGSLPIDLHIDDTFADPAHLTIRAGGAPAYVVLITPAWFTFLVERVRQAS